MKRTIIGSVFMLSGILVSMSILICAVILLPTVGAWNGSKLLAAISANELGLPFAVGIILSIIGLIIVTIEYFNKSN